MSKRTAGAEAIGERRPVSVGVRLARAVATIERQRRQLEMFEQLLSLTEQHVAWHHDGFAAKTCGWERDILMRIEMAKSQLNTALQEETPTTATEMESRDVK